MNEYDTRGLVMGIDYWRVSIVRRTGRSDERYKMLQGNRWKAQVVVGFI